MNYFAHETAVIEEGCQIILQVMDEILKEI